MDLVNKILAIAGLIAAALMFVCFVFVMIGTKIKRDSDKIIRMEDESDDRSI